MGEQICVVGLGYVGLPLAIAFAKKNTVYGFDINQQRILQLKKGYDKSLDIEADVLHAVSKSLHLMADIEQAKHCTIYIVTVPTPVDEFKSPDFSALIDASCLVASVLKKGDLVIYESTVYPGATEEICIPELEKHSGLIFNKDFYCGYSPERVNPGDKKYQVGDIKKVTSGSTKETAERVDDLYQSIIKAGTYKASSMKVAEASKVIENTQRDINIALINELALIFNRLEIDTEEVLEAAGTKWNFLPFRPGLVGGHCIGVDPYYLAHKAIEVGYHPEIILAGRRLNDNMPCKVVAQVIKLMNQKSINVLEANVLVMGVTFKENCPDTRNSKAIDLVHEFESYNCRVDVFDPWVDAKEMLSEHNITLTQTPQNQHYDTIVIAVAHEQFKQMGHKKIKQLAKAKHVIYDIKYVLPATQVDGRL